MITDLFLNSCFSLVFSNHGKVKKESYRDILSIISFVEKKDKLDIPVVVKNKTECLKEICRLKLDDKQDDNIVDSILASEKFKGLSDFIESKRLEKNDDQMIKDHKNQIRLRRKFVDMFPNYDSLNKFLDTAKNGSFDSLDTFVNDYDLITKEMYSNLMRTNRLDSNENCSSLDLLNDSFDTAVEQIKAKYDSKNTVPTGIRIFDNEIFNGGYAKSRLYLFGGGSSSGKSTLMLNTFASQVTGINIDGTIISKLMEQSNVDPNPQVYLYVTLENQIDESLLRLYQSQFNKTEVSALRSMKDGDFVKQELSKKLRKNAVPVIKYYPKYSIGVIDLMTIIDDVESQYGKGSLKCLYVDYLDLLKGETKYDAYRLELGFITSGLKDLAVEYNIPVVSGSQLNKSVYGADDSKSFNLGMVSESMKKVDHADFVSMMIKDRTDQIVHMRVGKNRGGISEVSLDFNVKFEIFKFINGFKVTASSKKLVESGVDASGGTFTGGTFSGGLDGF